MTDKLKESLKRFAQVFGADLNELMTQTVPDYTNTDLTLLKPAYKGGKRRKADTQQLATSRLTPKE